MVTEKFKKTFSSDNSTNGFLLKEREYQLNTGILSAPAVIINNRTVKGSLAAEMLMDDICNSLNNPPPACDLYTSSTSDRSYKVEERWWIILVVLIVGLILFTIMVIWDITIVLFIQKVYEEEVKKRHGWKG